MVSAMSFQAEMLVRLDDTITLGQTQNFFYVHTEIHHLHTLNVIQNYLAH